MQSMTSLNLILHTCETRKLVMATLHGKQGLLFDTMEFYRYITLYFKIRFVRVHRCMDRMILKKKGKMRSYLGNRLLSNFLRLLKSNKRKITMKNTVLCLYRCFKRNFNGTKKKKLNYRKVTMENR